MRACLVALALPDQLANTYQLPPRTLRPVQGSIASICDRPRTLPDRSALAAFLPDLGSETVDSLRKRSALASRLVTGLELARNGKLMLDQAEAWQIISVSRQAYERLPSGR